MAKTKTKKKDEKKEYTAEEIIELVEKKLESQPFMDMLDQMDEDFDLYALKEYVAEADHKSYTSPSPRNDLLKIFHGVNKADLTWHIMVPEDADDKERDAANMGEALITGIIDLANRQLRKTGEPSIREGVSWYGCNRGVTGLKCLIYTDDNGETVVDIRPTDSLHMVWEKGVSGLVWWAYLYNISKAEARERYDLELIGETDGVIIDFFTNRINAVVLKEGVSEEGGESKSTGKFVKEPTPHELNRIPAGVFFAGGMPTVYDRDGNQQLKHRAQSVYNSSRNIYAPRNEQVSFIMDIAEKSVAGTLVFESEDGKKLPKGDPFANYSVIPIKKGESIKPLDPPKVPAESGVILSILDRDKQESTVVYPQGYGLDPGNHSGAALSMMNDNMRSIYSPFTGMVTQCFQWLCEEILSQFKAKGQKMTLRGFDPSGKFYSQEFNPAEIQDDWYLQVKCEPKLPRDEAGELQMALAATNDRPGIGPLLSWLTAMEKIIQLQNPEAEKKRLERQNANNIINKNPVVQVMRLAEELSQSEFDSDKELAKRLLATVPGGPDGEQAAGIPQGAPQPPPPGNPAGGQQIPPEVQQAIQQVSQQLGIPPEQVARMRPEEIQAALAQKQGG